MDDEKLGFMKPQPPSIQNDLNNLLAPMFNQLTPRSQAPTIGPQAGWWKRFWHDHKLDRYLSIASKESAIAENNLKNAKSQQEAMITMLTFTHQLQDKMHEYYHSQRMRDADYQTALHKIGIMEAKIRKMVAETRRINAEAEIDEAEARKISGKRRVYDYEDVE